MRTPAPDQIALEVAHRGLRTDLALEQVLANPALRIILENRARQHMQRRARTDVKKLQANDND
jgi:hypothetical protein